MNCKLVLGLVAVLLTPVVAHTLVVSTSSSVSIENASCTDSGFASAGCHVKGSVPRMTGDMAFNGYSGAQANDGFLSAEVTVHTGPPYNAAFNVSAVASITRTITLTGGMGSGFINYEIFGHWGGASDLIPSVITITQDGLTQRFSRFSSSGIVPYSLKTQIFPFTYNVPFTVTMQVLAQTLGYADGGGFATTTLALANSNIFSSTGMPLLHSISEASNPEPGNAPLSSAGLPALYGFHVRRRCVSRRVIQG